MLAANRLREVRLAASSGLQDTSNSEKTVVSSEKGAGSTDSPAGIPPQGSKLAGTKPDPKAKPFTPGIQLKSGLYTQWHIQSTCTHLRCAEISLLLFFLSRAFGYMRSAPQTMSQATVLSCASQTGGESHWGCDSIGNTLVLSNALLYKSIIYKECSRLCCVHG